MGKGGGAKDRAADELALGTDKLYFKIGEVAEIVGVAPHVLRYWETEFATLRPQKSRTQQRVYRRRDVATLLRIKRLLYVEKFTIAGARKQLREHASECALAEPAAAYVARQSLLRVRLVVEELQGLLASSDLDPAGADPAEYLWQVGGARGLVEAPQAPGRALVDRPSRSGR
jgi:DNA-binding transcriptional MerR regulator